MKSFNALVECASDDNYFNKQLPYIANNISDKFCELLLDLLDDDNVHSSIKTNILKIILYSKKKTNITLDKIIGIIDKSTKDQKTIIYDILSTMKSKKLLSKLYKIKLEDSLLIMLILNNYSEDKYEEVHNKIAKLKIDYANSNNWFEIESDLIKCTNKKNIDDRLLVDLKFFLKNGLSSNSRYKIVKTLINHNMLDVNEIKSLKYDANYKIRKIIDKLFD